MPFGKRGGCALIGMVHVAALPGTPYAEHEPEAIERLAVRDAAILARLGYDGILVENMHDRPYVHGVQDPVVVACMTRVVRAVRSVFAGTLGVQILSLGNREALAVAHATGADFIRCENFVFAHVGDEGLHDRAEAGALLRYRRAIGATRVRVVCDVQKKHASHALTGDLELRDWVEGATFFGADGIVVTGRATGRPTSPDDVCAVSQHTALPVLVGSGVTPERIGDLAPHANALIVGSFIKQDGTWSNPIDEERARLLKARSQECGA